ncbi:MAG: tetratricopeptide repeat protein [Alphaproteobacteria bacterium]|nr:tetratricopeptide repeat protein [Alphaproteobacteria bacterium]
MISATRKLTAILAADVAGYSRLMGADEEGTLNRLKAHRHELIDPKIAEHRGRIVKTTGDGMLVEFASVVDAVKCAVEVQKAMRERETDLAADRLIQFRIGVNVGDILIDGDDIHGDGVNVAARLEALAEPGTICLSGGAWDQARGKVSATADDLGEKKLKNIERPVRVYRILPDAAPVERPALALPDKPSIAVLPFQNMSGDPEQEYFADGMAEDITTALSRLRWFFVIARNSSFTYKGRAVDVKQVARDLGVRYVLEGSVRKSGQTVRITAQLIDAVTGNHIWAGRYDRGIADIFAVQDEITESVVSTIEPQLYAAENLRIQSTPPENLDAWGCVIRAHWHFARMSGEDSAQARELLERAVSLSPSYARAHSMLAHAQARSLWMEGADVETVLPSARRHVALALSLDEDDPWGHFALGVTHTLTGDHETALDTFRRAIDLNPNFAQAIVYLALSLARIGKPDLALKMLDHAMRISPRDPMRAGMLFFTAVAHFVAERYREGIAFAQQALQERPSYAAPFQLLAVCHAALGEMDRARAAVVELQRLLPAVSSETALHGWIEFTRPGDQERWTEFLRLAGAPG